VAGIAVLSLNRSGVQAAGERPEAFSPCNLRSYFSHSGKIVGNADEIGICSLCTNPPTTAKTERIGTKTAESERKTAEKTAECFRPVLADREWPR
jgi:hypothetical protein